MYTLAQLAHFDRCLFSNDLAVKLLDLGVHEYTVDGVERFINNERRKGSHVGIIRVYQEFITDEELTKALDTVVSEFAAKYK